MESVNNAGVGVKSCITNMWSSLDYTSAIKNAKEKAYLAIVLHNHVHESIVDF